jgi:hypothetical protein
LVTLGPTYKSAAEKAADPARKMFYVGPWYNDTIVMPAQHQMSSTPLPGFSHPPLYGMEFSVPPGEVWCIKDILHMLNCDASINPVQVFAHIFCNESDSGTNTQVWSKQGHFAQWQMRAATEVPGAPGNIVPPDRHLVTDVGDANYWRYQPPEYNVYIPLPGPCVVQVGMFNNNEVGTENVAAHLCFSVLKWFPPMPPR